MKQLFIDYHGSHPKHFFCAGSCVEGQPAFNVTATMNPTIT
jgi:hypothetical protein